jgi:hypothetical protein
MSDDQTDRADDDATQPDVASEDEAATVSVAPFIDDDDDDGDDGDPSGDAGEDLGDGEDPEPATTDKKAKADAIVAERTVTRRTVTSRRVTPKAGAKAEASGSKARDARKTDTVATRKTPPVPPSGSYARGPSPWWVPAIMFGLLLLGALLIMANYSRLLGEPNNIRLVVGLGFILGGIITATQYR